MNSKKKKTKAARVTTIEMDSAHLEPVLNLIERGRMIPIRSRNARQVHLLLRMKICSWNTEPPQPRNTWALVFS